MLSSGAIEQDNQFIAERQINEPDKGQIIVYRAKNTDNLIYRKKFQVGNFVKNQKQLEIANQILGNSSEYMPSPAPTYTLQKQTGAIIGTSSDPSLYFQGGSFTLYSLRTWLNQRRESLTQSDLDVLIAFFLELLSSGDDTLNIHRSLCLKDVYFDSGRLRVMSPLISDSNLHYFFDSLVGSIVDAGADWKPGHYAYASVRRDAAASSNGIKRVLSLHEESFDKMVQRCFVAVLALMGGFDENFFFYADGIVNQQAVRQGLEVAFVNEAN
jgi:hypothetical protein